MVLQCVMMGTWRQRAVFEISRRQIARPPNTMSTTFGSRCFYSHPSRGLEYEIRLKSVLTARATHSTVVIWRYFGSSRVHHSIPLSFSLGHRGRSTPCCGNPRGRTENTSPSECPSKIYRIPYSVFPNIYCFATPSHAPYQPFVRPAEPSCASTTQWTAPGPAGVFSVYIVLKTCWQNKHYSFSRTDGRTTRRGPGK